MTAALSEIIARDLPNSIQFGAFAPSIFGQFEPWLDTDEQIAEVRRIDLISGAVSTLKVHGFMGDQQAGKAFQKLIKRTEKVLRSSCSFQAALRARLATQEQQG